MAGTTRKTPAKGKPAPKKDAEKKPEAKNNLVEKMHPDAYQLAIRLINSADVKGGDAETVVLVKRELARVAGEVPGAPRS